MKKYVDFAKYYICLLSLFCLGGYILLFAPKEATASETENRMLQGFPTLSLSSLADGSYMDLFEAYLSDAFPGRAKLIAVSNGVMDLFDRADKAEDLKAAVGAEMGVFEEELPEEVPIDEEEAPPEPEAEEQTAQAPETKKAVSGAAAWQVRPDGRREVTESYSAARINYLAGVLNKYRACLGENGRVFFINAPASDYVNAIFDQHRYTDWGYDLDEVMQPLLDDNVKIYSAQKILDPWKREEKLYSKDDFHWLIHTAWRISNAFVEDMGYAPSGFLDYSYYLRYSLNNGPYTPEQLRNMTVKRNDLMVPLVLSPVKAALVKKLTQKTPSGVYDFTHHGYTMYFGGTKGPYRLFETGFHTGHNALVICDSFGLAMLYYLFPYYDNVMQTDFRDRNYQVDQVGASVRQYIEEYGIDDVYFITCTYTSINSAVFTVRAERFLNKDYGKQ